MLKQIFYFFFPILLIVPGCKSPNSKTDNFFYVNLYSGITSLDPAFARSQFNIWVDNQLYNGLVQLDDSLKVNPCIAKRWVVSDDGLVYTFYLRKKVLFHDDKCFNNKKREVHASDFVYSFNRIMNGKTASPGAWIFNDRVKKQYGFVADNDSTLSIHLIKNFPPFLQLLAMQYASVIPKEAVDFYGEKFRKHPVGTGPFRLRFYEEGEKLVLAKNENYFETENGLKLPKMAGIVFSFIDNKQNEFFSFMQGKLDMVSGIDQSFKDNLLTKEGELLSVYQNKFIFSKSDFLNTEYLGFRVDDLGQKKFPKQMRQAINYAINKPRMMRFLRNNIGRAGEYGFVPPSLFHYAEKFYSYNPDKARQLMKEAGFDEKHPAPVLKITTTANYLDLCIYIQKDLAAAGIKSEIDNVPSPTLSAMKMQGSSDFFRGSWIADYPDAENYLSIFYSKNIPPAGPDYFRFFNTTYDSLYLAALDENNPEHQYKIFTKMQNILNEEAPVVVLYYDETIRLVSQRVGGLKGNPINLLNLKNVWLKKPKNK